MHREVSHALQVDQAEISQMPVERDPVGRTERPLTPPSQVTRQSFPRMLVQMSVRPAGITLSKIVPPAAKIAIDSTNQRWQRQETVFRRGQLPQAVPGPAQ